MRKSDCILGLETVLNNPKTSFMKNDNLQEIVKQSGMSLTQAIKHIGRTSKKSVKAPEMSDEEKSKMRLAALN